MTHDVRLILKEALQNFLVTHKMGEPTLVSLKSSLVNLYFTVNPNKYDLFTQLTSNPVVLESNSWTQIASFSMCKEVLFLF